MKYKTQNPLKRLNQSNLKTKYKETLAKSGLKPPKTPLK